MLEDLYDKVKSLFQKEPAKPKQPASLEEGFKQLAAMEGVERFVREDELNVIMYHHTVGRMIRNNWGLWTDSSIAQYFKTRGVTHPDEMSHIILTAFHRQQNKKPKDLDGLIRDSVEQAKALRQPSQ